MSYTYSEELYSDLYKEAYGFRPCQAKFIAWNAMTPDEKQKNWDYLLLVLDQTIANEKEAEARASTRFEKRVADTISSGAGDRKTAIRWIAEAEDCNGDLDHLCYKMGLSYSYFKEAG